MKLELTEKEVTEAIAAYLRRHCIVSPCGNLSVSLTFDHTDSSFGAIVDADTTHPFTQVVQAVCLEYGITTEEIHSKARSDYHVTPRSVAYYVLRCLQFTFEDIALYFHKDHGTIMHGAKSALSRSQTDSIYRGRVERVLQKLGLPAPQLSAKHPSFINNPGDNGVKTQC
jgi:hypothetical protein